MLPREDSVVSTLFRKLTEKKKHISGTPGVGGGAQKLWERWNNYSGTEKDAVITMTHQTVGRFQLFFSSTEQGRKIRGCTLPR